MAEVPGSGFHGVHHTSDLDLAEIGNPNISVLTNMNCQMHAQGLPAALWLLDRAFFDTN